MRAATTKLETDMGSFTKLADLRNELDATKQRESVASTR